jgi:alkylated DNA repair protein alkB family protein 8
MYPSRKSVIEMSNDEVERYVDNAVQDVKGWEALAGVIERTRRFNFDPTLTSSSTCHPHLNQLTVNEYNPGQGIGSHIDTETAFGDGILIITLNGGIVMEFRMAVDDDNVSSSSSSITASNDDNNNGISCMDSSKNKIQQKKLLYLPPRSLMLLSGDARYKWEHMIVSRTTDTVDGTVLARKMRLSLTLRTALSRPIQEGDRLMAAITSPLPIYESSTFPPRWGQLSESFPATATPTYDNTSNSHTSATLPRSMSTHNRSDLVTPVTESKHVHAVYNAIATQWHHTRGKRGVLWPGATQFLNALPPGSLVADVGCGDGKYFSAITAASSYVIGTDISEPLLKTAVSTSCSCSSLLGEEEDDIIDGPQYQRLSKDKRTLSLRPAVAVADCINLPLRSQSFDAAICIAVMHHLSTEGRRIRCLSELQRIVKAGGLINVMAWALEQEDDSKRKFHGTDVLVPFNAQPKYLEQTLSSTTTTNDSNSSVNPVIETSTKRKGVAEMLAEQYSGAEFDSKKNLVVFQRYCHMYRRGELEELCARVPGLRVLESSYEKGNHVVLLRRL